MPLPELSQTEIVAWLALGLSGINTFNQWRMRQNDSKRMRRRTPVLELPVPKPHDRFKGWDASTATIRNLEPVGINITGLRARPKKGLLINHVVNSEPDRYGGKDPSRLVAGTAGARFISLNYRLAPVGTTSIAFGPRDTLTIALLTQRIRGPTDLRLEWEWQDGHKT